MTLQTTINILEANNATLTADRDPRNWLRLTLTLPPGTGFSVPASHKHSPTEIGRGQNCLSERRDKPACSKE